MKLFKFLRASVLALALTLFFTAAAYCTDISITAANVVPDDGYQYQDVVAGEAVTAGQVLYISSGTTAKIAHCETSTATAAARGIALHAASTGQPLRMMTGGTITIGGTVALGKVYVLSASGGIAPVGDLANTDYVTVLGVGTTTAKIRLLIYPSGVKHP